MKATGDGVSIVAGRLMVTKVQTPTIGSRRTMAVATTLAMMVPMITIIIIPRTELS